MSKQKKLFLLDAYALIYRAYFAFSKNPRINSRGLNTSAVFGFMNSLIDVIKKENPTHLAVVFDTKEPTERHIEYPEYKANREEMPESLREALPYIDRLLEAFNIPKIFKIGFEADDIIGTLAKQAEQKGFQVFMMTSDKDFAQLVSENIFMYRPGNKWQPTTIWGINEVLDKFQIQRVDQVIDFLAMMGDTADNIPGISGVGKKTAQKFIKDFGSIEGLFANSHKLQGKIREKVEASKDIGALCKRLVTIITDVPVEFSESLMKLEAIDFLKTEELFKELEFRNMLDRIVKIQFGEEKFKKVILTGSNKKESSQMDLFAQIKKTKEAPIENQNYLIISNKNSFLDMIDSILVEGRCALQILVEESNEKKTSILGFSLAINDFSYYFESNVVNNKFLKQIVEDSSIEKIGFNIKFIIKALKRINIQLKGHIFDVQLAHYLLHPERRHSLEILSENYLGVNLIRKSSLLGKGKNAVKLSSLSAEKILNYVAQESDVIFQLSAALKDEMINQDIEYLYNNIELPLSIVLADMENQGINLNIEMLDNYSKELSEELDSIIQNIYKLAGKKFNIASPKQMGEVLFEQMKLSKKPKKTKSGQYSTSEETLYKIKEEHKIIEEILEFRSIKKLLSTYVDALPKLVNPLTKKIHTTFNQSVTSTGRLSSTNPNIQNIPIRTKRGMRVREAFIAHNKEYKILAADYSQIELRIMASLSKDQEMVKAFKQGIDIHSVTAAKVYKVPVKNVTRQMRSHAKAVNFGIIYGISPFGLSQNIGVSRSEAKEIIDQYFEDFPNVKIYMDLIIKKARELEYVETLMGRRRYLHDINSKNAVMRAVAERNAINAPIQGAAADIIKKAMIEIHQEIKNKKMQSSMLLQVHDELVFDMHISEEEELRSLVKDKMENTINLEVPLIVKLGEGINWLEAH